MVPSVIVLALISNLQACTPIPTLQPQPQMPSPYQPNQPYQETRTTTTTSPFFRHAAAKPRNLVKREAETILVTVVSNQKYDPSKNSAHLQVFRNLAKVSTKYMGIVLDKNKIKDRVINSDGNFGVQYKLYGFDCEGVTQFLKDTVSSAIFITSVKIKCGNEPETVLKEL